MLDNGSVFEGGDCWRIWRTLSFLPNGLSVCRLFYAGACEGQMPEILTMIQIKKMTPTPAVLCMVGVPCFLFMFSPNKML